MRCQQPSRQDDLYELLLAEEQRAYRREHPRALLVFSQGLDAPPEIFPLGDTAEESEALLVELLRRALEGVGR